MSTDTHIRGSVSERHTKLPWLYVVYHAPLRLVRPVPLFQLWRATSLNYSDALPQRWIVSTTATAAPIAQVGFRYLTERATTLGFSDYTPLAARATSPGFSDTTTRPWTLRPTIS